MCSKAYIVLSAFLLTVCVHAQQIVKPLSLYGQQTHFEYVNEHVPQQFDKNYITLFAHGLGATYHQAHTYCQSGLFCQKVFSAFNFLDAPETILKRNTYTGLAQTSEIAVLKQAFLKTIELDIDGVILYGVSRGASTIINMVAELHKQGYDTSSIKAIILESPFADAEDTLAAFATKMKMPIFFTRFLVKRFFKEYDRYLNKPLHAVYYIPDDIPVLLIGLANDTIVPFASTLTLYNAFKEHGHTKTHLLTLYGNGLHANLFYAEQNHMYYPTVHAFYQQYQLPHDANAITDIHLA